MKECQFSWVSYILYVIQCFVIYICLNLKKKKYWIFVNLIIKMASSKPEITVFCL